MPAPLVVGAVALAGKVGSAAMTIGSFALRNPIATELACSAINKTWDFFTSPKEEGQSANPFTKENIANAARGTLNWASDANNITHAANQLNNMAVVFNAVRDNGVKNSLSNIDSILQSTQSVMNVFKPNQEQSLNASLNQTQHYEQRTGMRYH